VNNQRTYTCIELTKKKNTFEQSTLVSRRLPLALERFAQCRHFSAMFRLQQLCAGVGFWD
jgi:hypothetical protein